MKAPPTSTLAPIAPIAPIAAILAALIAGCTTADEPPVLAFLPNATIVASEPDCYECSIELERVQDLAEARDKDVLNGDLRALVRTDDGTLVTAGDAGAPLLFGPDGRLVRPISGRTGEPPHFARASLMRKGVGDSIYVLDEFEKRITVLGPFLNVVRTIPADAPITDMVPLRGGDIVLASQWLTPGGDSTTAIAILSAQSGTITPLAPTAVYRRESEDPNFAARVLAPARDGQHFWSAHTIRYAIEKRTLTGELVLLLERDAEWFRPTNTMAPVSPRTAPTPRIVAIWEDARGFIWVHSITADGRWGDAVGTLNGVDGEQQYFVHSRDLYYDTRLEVLDPESGNLVATAKFDTALPTFTPGPYLSRVVTGAMGWLIGELYQARLTGRPGM